MNQEYIIRINAGWNQGINTIRIYNLKNSKEHDENGEFIKKWVPELSNIQLNSYMSLGSVKWSVVFIILSPEWVSQSTRVARK